MTYWRMQLHPSNPAGAIKDTAQSLSAGYIGLDFVVDVPDLLTTSQADLPKRQKHYWRFAHEMRSHDWVLLSAHHYPFALVRVKGEYNYIRERAPELGVWFRHFRAVECVEYYGDYITNPADWEKLVMTATITPLRRHTSKLYLLIERWLKSRSHDLTRDPGSVGVPV